jgi:hypothetical protein
MFTRYGIHNRINLSLKFQLDFILLRNKNVRTKHKHLRYLYRISSHNVNIFISTLKMETEICSETLVSTN